MKPALHKPAGYCIGMYRIPRCPEESLFYNRRHSSQNVSLVDVLFDLFAMTCEDQWMITSLYPHVHILKTYRSTYILYMILYPSIPQLSKLLFACFFKCKHHHIPMAFPGDAGSVNSGKVEPRSSKSILVNPWSVMLLPGVRHLKFEGLFF